MNSTRTLKSIIVALLIALGLSVYLNSIEVKDEISKNQICNDYSTVDMNTLSTGVVHEIVNGYKHRQLSYINARDLSMTDSKAIWFDLETIKKFIYHVEVNSQSLDNTISSADLGLRFYYASYPDVIDPLDPELGDLYNMGYDKRHTLVAIPTKRIGAEEVDFNPLDIATYAAGLKGTTGYEHTDGFDTYNFRNPKKVAVLGPATEAVIDGPPLRTGAQNHGQMYPPFGINGLNF